MKQSLSDLNSYLFDQLESLSNGDLNAEELESEIKRGKSITEVAKVVVENAKVVLDATKHADEYYGTNSKNSMPQLLIGKNDE